MRSPKRSGGEVELDLGRYELRRSGRRVKLEKKPMELLIFLVGRRDQLVTRDDIVRRLWRSDLFIDVERNLNNLVRKIRTALGDDFERSKFIETVVGKGYRFVGPVRVIEARYESHSGGAPLAAADNGDRDDRRPSLAVLPPVLVGNVKDETGISLGFADALAARLGNLEDAAVLPMSAALQVASELSPAEAAAQLGVRFVVRGAMQMAKGQWRLSVELYDARLQRAHWSRRCDIDVARLSELESELASQIAATLKRPLDADRTQRRSRYTRDPLAYGEFTQGYRLSASGDPGAREAAIGHLTNAVTRDPAFALAHATLSLACATRHYESDPANVWLEKAEFHCHRALEIDAELPEGHVARAFLLWGPSKNFQHLEAIAELKRALALQANLAHAYNRLGTILAHVGLLEEARAMYERGRPFNPGRRVSHSIVHVHVWNHEYDAARQHIEAWRRESPSNKYAIQFAPQLAMMTGDWDEAQALLDEAQRLLAGEPLIISMQGVLHALQGRHEQALGCMAQACASPKSFGHAHHTYYHLACILALAGQRATAFEWLERSVSSGFACWPFFLRDRCLENLHGMPEFQLLVSSLQAKYPPHLGML